MSANTEAQRERRGTEAMKWIIVAVLLIVAMGSFRACDIMLAVCMAVVILIAAAGGISAVDDERVRRPLLLLAA